MMRTFDHFGYSRRMSRVFSGVELNYEGMEEELTCPVCLELYADPLMLPCSHSICKKCLNDIADRRRTSEKHCGVECPSCRRVVEVVNHDVNSLPRNLALENIVIRYTEERSKSIRKSLSLDSPVSDLLLPAIPPTIKELPEFPTSCKTTCELCEGLGPCQAAWFCLQCEVAYCHACFAKYHPRRGALARHKVRQPTENEEESKPIYCNDHETEPANIFCDKCKTLICSLCVCEGEGKHSGHTVLALDTASKKIRECVNHCGDTTEGMLATLQEQQCKMTTLQEDMQSLHQDMRERVEVQYRRMVDDITVALHQECDKTLERLHASQNKFQEQSQAYLTENKRCLDHLTQLSQTCKDLGEVKGIYAALSKATELEPLLATLKKAQERSASVTGQYDQVLKDKSSTQELQTQMEQFRTNAVTVVRAMFDENSEHCECIIPLIKSPSSPGKPEIQPRIQNKYLTTWGFSSTSFTGEELSSSASWTVTIERNAGHWGNFNTGYLFGVGLASAPLGLKTLVGMNDKSHGIICTGGSMFYCHNSQQDHLLPLDSLPVAVTISVNMDQPGYSILCYKLAPSGQGTALVGRRVIPEDKFKGHHFPVFTVSQRVKLLFPTFV